MCLHLNGHPSRAWRSAALLAAFLSAEPLPARTVDLNGNGMSDIWELIYGASALDPNADSDGDGVSNLLESIAGTNPLDPTSVPRISGTSQSGTNFSVSMPCALGKQYSLQSSQGLDLNSVANWMTEVSIVARTGTVVTLTAPVSLAPKFFRIAISDVDTDGDGVNDWEEYKLGLDPTKASSNNQLDGNGQPMSDYAYVVSKLPSQNLVSIAATGPTAIEPDLGQNPSNFGQYTVSRGGFPLNTITVKLGLGGPGPGYATEGLDHLVLPRSVILPAGASSKTITLAPHCQHQPAGAGGGHAQRAAGTGLHRQRFQQCQRHHLPVADAQRAPASPAITTPTPARPIPAAPTSTRPT